MKKWIVVIVLLVFVLGGGVAAFVGLKDKGSNNPTADTEIKTTVEEESSPCILAKEKFVLVEGEKSANTNAIVYDAENVSIDYLSLDTNIATVDSLGNVCALKEGSTVVKNSFVLDGVECSFFNTQIIVLPKEVSGTLTLLDENKKEATNVILGNKYYLNYTTTSNLKYYEISFDDKNIKVTQASKQDNTFCCEIYFEAKCCYELKLKLNLKADNIEKAYYSNTLTFDNSEKQEDPVDEPTQVPTEPTPSTPSEPTPADPTPSTPQTPVEPTPATPSESTDPTPAEPIKPTPLTPTEKEESNTSPKQYFILGTAAGVSAQFVTIDNSTITYSNYLAKNKFSLSLTIDKLISEKFATNEKIIIRHEILSGNNANIIPSTSLLGFVNVTRGTLTFRLFIENDPSISQIFTLVVE